MVKIKEFYEKNKVFINEKIVDRISAKDGDYYVYDYDFEVVNLDEVVSMKVNGTIIEITIGGTMVCSYVREEVADTPINLICDGFTLRDFWVSVNESSDDFNEYYLDRNELEDVEKMLHDTIVKR